MTRGSQSFATNVGEKGSVALYRAVSLSPPMLGEKESSNSK